MNNLQRQVDEITSLLVLAYEKTDIVKQGDMSLLEAGMKQEQRLIFIMQQLEKERTEIVYRMMSGRPITSQAPTLADCLDLIDGIEKQELMSLKETLVEKTTELKQVNELNQSLISQSLQFVNVTLSMVQPLEPEPAYKKDHGQKEVKGHSLFNVKA
jgi:flagellar biosynthesis/type III secretory pathway chaperone